MRAAAVVVVVALQGCFLLVSSGIRREIPPGAHAAASEMVRSDENVVAAWDGSVLQDGGLLAVLTDRRLLKRADELVTSVDLRDVQTIVVNEDDGAVDVVTASARLSLPLRTSDERRAFARLIQTEVQKRKKSAHEDHEITPPPPLEAPPETPTTTTP
ncbi:MAG: hypothetical protein Q8O67_16950 [Deltaproteobacteria bacterium]|nr:hypothetical protein [Deltaproteobacteria bacterium]